MDPQLSYISTPAVGSYMYETLPERLWKLAEEDGEREAFVYYDRAWNRTSVSRKKVYDRSVQLAKNLVNMGLRHKATVGFCMSNSINMLIANMAVVCAGGIPFYVSTNLKDGSDVINLMNDMECQMFFIDTETGDANWAIVENIWPEKNSKSDSVPSLKTIICNGNIPEGLPDRQLLASVMNRIPDNYTKLPEIQPEDTLAYFCTSGSTGKPKEVIYTHFDLFNWTKQSDHVFNVTGKSRFFNDRTCSWIVGYPQTFLVEGVTRVLVDPLLTSPGEHIEKICDVIATEKCDFIYAPTTMAMNIADNPGLATRFQHVETIFVSGERFQTVIAGLQGTFCRKLFSYYGMTESGGAITFESSNAEQYEEGIIGKPIGGMEVKLIDEAGCVVQRGNRGELCLRSSMRCVGYRGNDKLFREAVDDANWLHTGDIAHMRQDGNLVIEGRRRDLISVQTNKFFPWVIEQTLKKMPGVYKAFAVGVPDKHSYQVVCACVVPEDGVTLTPDDVMKYCDDVFLEESSTFVVTSKPVYHVVLESVPLTRTAKVDRIRIGQVAKERLGL